VQKVPAFGNICGMTFDEAFERLGRSKFRSRFRLTAADWAYIERVGMDFWGETLKRVEI
jgi:hypothetical protein